MTAVDTSVVVAGFASWHEAHAAGATLLTRDERARGVCDRLGVRYEFVG